MTRRSRRLRAAALVLVACKLHGAFHGFCGPARQPIRRAAALRHRVAAVPEFAASTAAQFQQTTGLDSLGEDAFTFLSSAVIVYPICHQLGLTPLLGFLLAGVVLKQLGLFADNPDAMALADFGVLCLLFQIGLELTVERIQRLAQYAVNLGLPALAFSTLVFVLLETPPDHAVGTWLLETVGADPLLVGIRTFVEAAVIGVGLSLSSSAFVLQLLRDKGELETRVGGAVVGTLLIQDIAVVPLLALLPVLQSLQDPSSPHPDSPEGLLALSAVALKGLLFLGIVVGVSRVVTQPFLDAVASTFGQRSDALTASTIFTVAVASLCTKEAGFSDSLGAFLVGCLLAESSQRHYIDEALAPFRGLLLGLFFLTVGSTLDLSVLLTDLPAIVLLLIGVLGIKAMVITALGPFAGLTRSESIRTGLLLAQGGEFSFVVFKLACELQILPEDLNRLLIIVVVLSIALTPVLDAAGQKLAEWVGDEAPEPAAQVVEVEAVQTAESRPQPAESQPEPADITDDDQSTPGELPFSTAIYNFQMLPVVEVANVALTGLGCLVFAVRTMPDLDSQLSADLVFLEDLISLAFLIDFLLRWWSRGLRSDYLVSTPMLLDFLSFLPFLLKTFTSLGDGVELNFFRLLRVLSFYRFLRPKEFQQIALFLPVAVREVRPWQLQAARVVGNIFTLTFIMAGVIYEAEHGTNPSFKSFFDAFYFSITALSTVGFGDIAPITPVGRTITSIAVLVGICLIPFQLGGVAKAIAEDNAFEEVFNSDRAPARSQQDSQAQKVREDAHHEVQIALDQKAVEEQEDAKVH